MLLAGTLGSASTNPGKPKSSKRAASPVAKKSGAHTSPVRTSSASASHPAKAKRTHSTSSKSQHGKKSHRAGKRGQQNIDSQRTREIQEALIRQRYLQGAPTGVWDDATQQALRRLQGENRWQTKTVPDARALIKLGLGPNHDRLLNPESAMTTQPQAPTSNHTPAGPHSPQRSENQPQR